VRSWCRSFGGWEIFVRWIGRDLPRAIRAVRVAGRSRTARAGEDRNDWRGQSLQNCPMTRQARERWNLRPAHLPVRVAIRLVGCESALAPPHEPLRQCAVTTFKSRIRARVDPPPRTLPCRSAAQVAPASKTILVGLTFRVVTIATERCGAIAQPSPSRPERTTCQRHPHPISSVFPTCVGTSSCGAPSTS
jgi:hypothetical protein